MHQSLEAEGLSRVCVSVNVCRVHADDQTWGLSSHRYETEREAQLLSEYIRRLHFGPIYEQISSIFLHKVLDSVQLAFRQISQEEKLCPGTSSTLFSFP